ncbi:MAG: heavy-metal-associated domain-containing protein [Burkholderiaceae bacterium]
MFDFTIPAMSCGRCVAAITQAVRAIDPEAKLDFDLASRAVRIDSSLPATALEAALDKAGYAPQSQTPAAAPASGCCSASADRSAAPRRGCCCG